jgi:hypothetical protein
MRRPAAGEQDAEDGKGVVLLPACVRAAGIKVRVLPPLHAGAVLLLLRRRPATPPPLPTALTTSCLAADTLARPLAAAPFAKS